MQKARDNIPATTTSTTAAAVVQHQCSAPLWNVRLLFCCNCCCRARQQRALSATPRDNVLLNWRERKYKMNVDTQRVEALRASAQLERSQSIFRTRTTCSRTPILYIYIPTLNSNPAPPPCWQYFFFPTETPMYQTLSRQGSRRVDQLRTQRICLFICSFLPMTPRMLYKTLAAPLTFQGSIKKEKLGGKTTDSILTAWGFDVILQRRVFQVCN